MRATLAVKLWRARGRIAAQLERERAHRALFLFTGTAADIVALHLSLRVMQHPALTVLFARANSPNHGLEAFVHDLRIRWSLDLVPLEAAEHLAGLNAIAQQWATRTVITGRHEASHTDRRRADGVTHDEPAALTWLHPLRGFSKRDIDDCLRIYRLPVPLDDRAAEPASLTLPHMAPEIAERMRGLGYF